MALTPRLDLRQSQSLVMTPQLQQAIKLLQMSNMELASYLEGELERNPLLEREEIDAGSELSENSTAQESDSDGGTAAPEQDVMELTSSETLPSSGDAPLDSDDENLWSSADSHANDRRSVEGISDPAGDAEAGELYWSNTGSGGRSDFADDDFDLDQRLTEKPDLRRHLMEQIGVDIAEPAQRIIALHLTEMLDASGYLSGDIAQLGEQLGCPVEMVEATLEKLQQFDPAGIFARNLKECLAAQLKEQNRYDPAIEVLLENLDLLAKRDVSQLMRLCDVDAEDLAEMVAEVRALNPRPASAFDLDVAEPVTPDVIMRRRADGDWLVELNNAALPRVLVNAKYSALVTTKARKKEDREYIAEQLQTANWLVKSLHQRANTILKVATEIVRQQELFFIYGIQHLKPLILRDIAEVIGMHESTVSRVTSNKYMSTPRGVYELKYFFTSAIASAEGGDAHSAESVRHRIKQLIDGEDPKKILSDDKLVELLRENGVDIARRTVAKYREALKIPSSVQRRREKQISL